MVDIPQVYRRDIFFALLGALRWKLGVRSEELGAQDAAHGNSNKRLAPRGVLTLRRFQGGFAARKSFSLSLS